MAKAACIALLAAAAILVAATPAAAASGIIRVSNQEFVDEECNPFYFSGYNTWLILETAGGVCCGGRPSVERQLDAAKANNLTVIRMFAYGVFANYQLQQAPGQYNESALRDFDYIVSEASKRDLKLIVALASNWVYNNNSTGTKCYYTNYTSSTDVTNCDQFFSDPGSIELYKDWVKTITSRNNTITGVTYGSDPTIFAWNLMNEGRCETPDCKASDIQSWIANVAPYVKSNVKQLVTVGEDGFLQASNCLADKINPVTNSIGWPLQTGQDYLPNHAVDGIDFGSIHFWPDNWARVDLDFGRNWLTGHANLSSAVLKKPLIVEEFGKAFGGDTLTTGEGQTQQQQLDYYKLVYSIVETSFITGDIIKGIAFWRWSEAESPANSLAPFDDAASISTTGPTFSEVVGPFSQRTAQKLAAGPAAGCTPSSAGSSSAPATSTAGRRLMQSSPTSSPSSSAANINSLVPAELCGAYPPQPASVG